ncbi:MAG: enoyl-CoA hydratase/isomerase family protein [Acidimicrobiales bacterium]
MSSSRVDVEDDDGVRLVAFDRPEVLNAFDAAMYEATSAALDAALDDDGVRAVVLCGRGRAFTSGQDLREMAALATEALAAGAGGAPTSGSGSGFPRLLDALVSFDKPLLAAVHGVAVGLGCTLLGHVDMALVEEGTRLRAPFAELGVPPEAASSWLLPERMGWQRAAAVLLASEWIDAAGAVDAGLALRVCPPGTVLDEVLALARRIASFPPAATRRIKQLMTAARRPSIEAARAREDAAFASLFADPRTNPGTALTAGLGS